MWNDEGEKYPHIQYICIMYINQALEKDYLLLWSLIIIIVKCIYNELLLLFSLIKRMEFEKRRREEKKKKTEKKIVVGEYRNSKPCCIIDRLIDHSSTLPYYCYYCFRLYLSASVPQSPITKFRSQSKAREMICLYLVTMWVLRVFTVHFNA